MGSTITLRVCLADPERVPRCRFEVSVEDIEDDQVL
jgi:hypothetical protein